MSKISLTNLTNLQNETTAVNSVNANNAALTTALDNTLSRDGTSPNTMSTSLDMNSNQILNLPQPATATSPVRLQDVQTGGTVTNIPSGGTTGQVLAKTSNTDYAVGWTPTSSGFTAGTNIVFTGSSPTTISTATSPTFSGVVSGSTFSSVNKGNLLGVPGGSLTAPASTDANIKLYDLGSGNWSGFITDSGGNFGIRTGLSGTPDARLTILTDGKVGIGLIPTSPLHVVGNIAQNGATSGTSVLVPPATGGNNIQLFAGADTVVGRATTDTLTNKTLTTPTISNPAIIGTATNDNAAAGNWGEYVESVIASGSATALTNGIAKTITSISLTAGDWDVDSIAYVLLGATTSITAFVTSISGTTNTLDLTAGKSTQNAWAAFAPGAIFISGSIPNYRLSLSGTTTVYLIGQASFTVSTASGYGIIRARRIR